jgi:glycosyltransferase involved in cell wall biosynthesis
MKIAYVMINCNRVDGSARAVVEVAERMATGHEVHLFARKVEDVDLSRITWHRVPGPGWPEIGDFATFFALASRLVCATDYDIIHSVGCNVPHANVYTIQNIQPAKRRHLGRIASSEKVSLPRRFTRWLYLEGTSRAEHLAYTHRAGKVPPLFLPVSAGVARELREEYAIGPAPVHIIPNAADIEKFHPCSSADRVERREALGLKADHLLFAFVGGEWARKGLDLAIQSVARWTNSRARLVVFGSDPDSARFVRMAEDLGLSDRVVFAGFRRDLDVHLPACDAMLFPSWYEAFSLATIEAAACGLPLIAPPINGTEDFIEPGQTGYFTTHDPNSIAEVVNSVCERPERLAEMGRIARARVEANYTWDRVASLTASAYADYLAQSPTGGHAK